MIEFFTFLSGAIAFLSVLKNIKNIKLIFWIFTISLVLFDGLRWEMGVDWHSYFDMFKRADEYNQPGFELGFMFYSFLIRSITDNYSIYLLITTAIIYVGIYYTVFKMTNNSFMSIFYLTGTIPWYSGVLRQMLACVFFVLALKAIMDRKPIHFVVLMVMGLLFHTTILVFFPLYWLYGMSTVVFIFVFLSIFLVSYFSKNLISLLDIVIGFYFNRSYGERIGGANALTNPIFGFARKIATVLGFFLFSIAAKQSRTMDELQWKKVKFLLMLVSLSIVLYYIGIYQVEHVSSRLDIYISIISTSVLLGILDKLLNPRKRIMLFIFVVFLLSVFYSRLQLMELFHPYSSVFYNHELNRNYDVEFELN